MDEHCTTEPSDICSSTAINPFLEIELFCCFRYEDVLPVQQVGERQGVRKRIHIQKHPVSSLELNSRFVKTTAQPTLALACGLGCY